MKVVLGRTSALATILVAGALSSHACGQQAQAGGQATQPVTQITKFSANAELVGEHVQHTDFDPKLCWGDYEAGGGRRGPSAC